MMYEMLSSSSLRYPQKKKKVESGVEPLCSQPYQPEDSGISRVQGLGFTVGFRGGFKEFSSYTGDPSMVQEKFRS